MISLTNYQLTKDIINLEPTNIKSVLIDKSVWNKIRPIIKDLQKNGLWYDVSEDGNKIYLRCKVNEITQAYIESLL